MISKLWAVIPISNSDYEWFSASNRDFPSDAFLYNYLQGGEYEKVNGRLGMESHKEEEKNNRVFGAY